MKREYARIDGISAFFDVPQMDPNWSSEPELHLKALDGGGAATFHCTHHKVRDFNKALTAHSIGIGDEHVTNHAAR